MTLLIVGAAGPAVATIRDLASSHRIEVQVGVALERPDWVVVANAMERADVVARYQLPAYRVIEIPDLAADKEPDRDHLRSAIAKMADVGAFQPRISRLGTAIARRVTPFLIESTTSLAADIARQRRIATTADGQDRTGRVLVIVSNLRELQALAGLVIHLSRTGSRVHLAIGNEPARTSDLSTWLSEQPGVTVGRTPPDDSNWRLATVLRESLACWRFLDQGRAAEFQQTAACVSPLAAAIARNPLLRASSVRRIVARALTALERATPLDMGIVAFLEESKADVLILAPCRSLASAGTDYLRTARTLGVWTMSVPVRSDVQPADDAGFEVPDISVVWNQEQCRDLVHRRGYPKERVPITGALLLTDLTDQSYDGARQRYCDRLGIDASRRIVVYVAPNSATPIDAEQFHRWRLTVQESLDPVVREAVMVVYVHDPIHGLAWRRIAKGTSVLVDRARADPVQTASRLFDGLIAADALVVVNETILADAAAYGRPTLIFAPRDAMEQGVARVETTCLSHAGWPLIAGDGEEHCRHLSMALGARIPADTLRQAAARVRPESNGTDTPVERVAGLVRELKNRPLDEAAPRRPSILRRVTVILCAALARRFDRTRDSAGSQRDRSDSSKD